METRLVYTNNESLLLKMWLNIAQFSLICFDKLYVFKKNQRPPAKEFSFAFLILPEIATHLGVLFKIEIKS